MLSSKNFRVYWKRSGICEKKGPSQRLSAHDLRDVESNSYEASRKKQFKQKLKPNVKGGRSSRLGHSSNPSHQPTNGILYFEKL